LTRVSHDRIASNQQLMQQPQHPASRIRQIATRVVARLLWAWVGSMDFRTPKISRICYWHEISRICTETA